MGRAHPDGGSLRIPRYDDMEDEGALWIVKAALSCEPGSEDDRAIHERMREVSERGRGRGGGGE